MLTALAVTAGIVVPFSESLAAKMGLASALAVGGLVLWRGRRTLRWLAFVFVALVLLLPALRLIDPAPFSTARTFTTSCLVVLRSGRFSAGDPGVPGCGPAGAARWSFRTWSGGALELWPGGPVLVNSATGQLVADAVEMFIAYLPSNPDIQAAA